MNYQVWKPYYPGSGYAGIEDMRGLSDKQVVMIFQGKRIPEPLPVVTLTRLTHGKLPDTMGTVTDAHVVSDVLQPIIASSGADLQFIPARIPRRPEVRFYIVNVISGLSCFDRERSRYKIMEGTESVITDLEKMALKPLPADAPAIFHMNEITDVILARDDLRESMQSASESPGTFVKVEEYTRA